MTRKTNSRTIRIAAIGDLHYGKNSHGSLSSLFSEISSQANILAIAGDLTDYGLPEEAYLLGKELATSVKIPVVAVLGNHDYESGKQDEVCQIMAEAGVSVLTGDSREIEGIGFAGTKGFAGGFGRGSLGYWGEPAIKAFVQEAIDESLKLESALARLRTEHRIALLHYSPIRETVEGEPPVIFPYLGSSRLEEPLNRYPVTAVFHGHAHNGSPEGQTGKGTPVYNVSLGVLRHHNRDRPPYRILELDVVPTADSVPVM